MHRSRLPFAVTEGIHGALNLSVTGAWLVTAARRPALAPTHRVPARGERGRVESLGGIERPGCSLRRLPADGPTQNPLAGEPKEAQPLVGQVKGALRIEVEIDRQLLDECRLAGRAGG